jgi:hypothetical protein
MKLILMFIDIDVDECMISMFIDIVKADFTKSFGVHEHEVILTRVGLVDGAGRGITEIDSAGIDGSGRWPEAATFGKRDA